MIMNGKENNKSNFLAKLKMRIKMRIKKRNKSGLAPGIFLSLIATMAAFLLVIFHLSLSASPYEKYNRDIIAQAEEKSGQKQTVTVFPSSEVGKQAESFWKAFERADRAGLTEFFRTALPSDNLRELPAEERAGRLLGLRQRFGEMRLIKVASPASGTIEIFITNNQKELFKIGLVFELRSNGQSKNYFLKGLLVDEAGPEDLAPPLPAMSLSQALQQIEEEIKRAAAEDKFSGVVLVAQNFQPIFFKAYGYASKEFSVPNQLNTRFNLGSINKIFTKIAIGQLAHKGKLSLDDRLGKFMPGYPNAEAREKVTVRHLVNMTSGIGDFFGPEFRDTPKDFIRHNRDYLRFFASKPLAFEPGSREMYSNGGYVVLGEIISAASGMDYYEYVRKNIFEPAGMKDSDWFEADAVVANVAEGYTKQQEELEKIESPPQDKTPAEQKLLSRPGKVMNSKAADKEESSSPGDVGTKNQEAEKVSHTSSPKNRVPRAEAIDPVGSVNPVLSQPQEQPANPTWRRNIYTRPARGSAAGGGCATAEDLLRFARALYECRLLSEPWTNWVFTGQEPEKTNSPKVGENRKQWSLAIAGGAPGINAVLEFDAGMGYTIIVLSNYDPPAAGQIARMVGRYLKAVQSLREN